MTSEAYQLYSEKPTIYKSTHTLELDFDGNVRVIDKEFNLICNPSYEGEIPLVNENDNKFEFECESKEQPRVRVTIGLLGENLE